MTTSRGFPVAEYRGRLARAQALMSEAGLDVILLTTEPDIRYFTGFLTRFWESPTRPWFLVLPLKGEPIAVIPGIGAALMAETWITDIRTWASPDLADDGVTLLARTLSEVVPARGRIGVPSGPETHLRMPLGDYRALERNLGGRKLTWAAGILRRLRMVKSQAEIAKIRAACDVAGRAFDRVPEIAGPGVALSQVFRRFQMLCLDEGADWVSYTAGGAGPGGYLDVIRPASDAPLEKGDVLMLDTGVVLDGYFCDFDRNFAIGPPTAETADAHARLIEATAAGFAAARPGIRAADLFRAMDKVLTGGAAPEGAGRLGHGLGMQLTEWPSLMPGDDTVIEAGMVLTLEPGLALGGGRIMVHEENIVVTETGAEWLTRPSKPEIVSLEGTP